MKTIKAPKQRAAAATVKLRETVAGVIDDIRLHGDSAVFKYSKKFDDSARTLFRVSKDETKAALESLSEAENEAILFALNNIKDFASAQKKTLFELDCYSKIPGVTLGHRVIPVDSACCYVPGGNYPLFSTALMLVAPAKVAGVKRVAACSPTVKGGGGINQKTLAAMTLAGADEIYAVGGAQAIAAFAYGTEQIKPVSLIAGPGNAYVSEAKRQCYGQVGIDFVAGPSEVLIIADDSANAAIIAADLLAQCEHDLLAQAILVTTSEKLLRDIPREIEIQLAELQTSSIAGTSWADYGALYLAETIDEAVEYANERACEHLELQTRNNEALIPALKNYGALFDGGYSAEVFGDYAAGTNHTLPTSGAARYTGGVWVGTFLKTLTFQRISKEGAAKLAPFASALAEAEGLFAHRAAARMRRI
jgi:histidinol dehydrogenase